MVENTPNDVAASYDLVADEYVRRIYDELRHKPLDRELLDRFAARIPAGQQACDLGCGPGQVAGYLHERGVRVCGVDLSREMLGHARRLNPGIDFLLGDMRSLGVAEGSWAGIAAFYATVNLPPDDLPQAFREILRVLQPGGLLLVSFHIGDDVVHLTDWWNMKVSIDFHFRRTGEVVSELQSAGFQIEEVVERDPYPEVEHQSRRAYVFARKDKPNG